MLKNNLDYLVIAFLIILLISFSLKYLKEIKIVFLFLLIGLSIYLISNRYFNLMPLISLGIAFATVSPSAYKYYQTKDRNLE